MKCRLRVALMTAVITLCGVTACSQELAPPAATPRVRASDGSPSGSPRPGSADPSRDHARRVQPDRTLAWALGAKRLDRTRLGRPVRFLPVEGTAQTRTDLVGGAPVTVTSGPGATGAALRFPSLSADPTAPRAVVRVANAGRGDALDPGSSPFRFGAVVRLDARSESGWTDNGNNLLQRGLYHDPAQYKIDLDHGSATCRVKGDAGTVEVRGALRIRPGDWYRIGCERVGRRVTLTMRNLDLRDGTHAAGSWWESAWGLVGSVHFSTPRIPLSLGGKLDESGRPEPATDQLNGSVASAFVDIGSSTAS